jgi:monothiol glutaredoxin
MSDINKKIEEQINSNDVVLYMKGSTDFPQCGFSSVTVQVLKKFNVPFQDVDVLADTEIREGIKKFSDWPTIPQLYIKGEFIGGCDIIREMHDSGEFEQLLKDKKII